MKPLRLVGFLLFAVGSAILIYLGIDFFVLKASYNGSTEALELLGFLLGLSGAFLARGQGKPPEMKL